MPAGQEMSSLTRTLKQLLDTYLAMPEVDKKRIYIVGLSMGAMGTYDLVVRYPEIFAAAVPICGSVNPDRLPAAKEVKFRIFHGDADDVVTVEGSREAYKALKGGIYRIPRLQSWQLESCIQLSGFHGVAVQTKEIILFIDNKEI